MNWFATKPDMEDSRDSWCISVGKPTKLTADGWAIKKSGAVTRGVRWGQSDITDLARWIIWGRTDFACRQVDWSFATFRDAYADMFGKRRNYGGMGWGKWRSAWSSTPPLLFEWFAVRDSYTVTVPVMRISVRYCMNIDEILHWNIDIPGLFMEHVDKSWYDRRV